MTPSEKYAQLRSTPAWRPIAKYFGLGPWLDTHPKLTDIEIQIRALLRAHEEYWFHNELMEVEQKKQKDELNRMIVGGKPL